MHLPGDRSHLASFGNLEAEDLHGLAADRLGDRHARRSGGRIDQHLDLTPLLGVELRVRQSRESVPAVVVPRPVVPVTAVGDLELDAAEDIQTFLALLRAGAKDEGAKPVWRPRSGCMFHFTPGVLSGVSSS